MADCVCSGSVQGARAYRKRNGFESRVLPVALESDENLLLKVESVARLPISNQKLM